MESEASINLKVAGLHGGPSIPARLWEALIGANPRIQSEEKQQQARLLSMILLALIVSGGLILIAAVRLDPNDLHNPMVQGGFVIVGIAAVMYVINRLSYTLIAAFGLTAVFAGIFLYLSFFVEEPNVQSLAFLLVPILLAAIFFPLRGVVAAVVLLLGASYAINNAGPHQGALFWSQRTLLYFLLISSTLLVTFIIHLRNLEKVRRSALEHANAKLRESETLLEQRVHDRTRDLKVAADVARQMTSALDLESLLPQIAGLTRMSFDLYSVSVFLHNQETGVLKLVAGTGEAGRRMLQEGKAFHISDRPGLVPQAGRERTSVLINDVRESSAHFVNPYLPQTRAEVAIPMLVGDRLIGVIDLQSEAAGRFGAEDLEILNTLAEQVAIAVQNAQLFAEAKAARAAAEQANEVKSRFLANMSHELRTPLNAILNFTAFVADGVLGPVTDEQVEVLTQSMSSGKHLLSLINDVLDITKIEAGMMDLFIQQVDFNEIVAGAESVAKGLVKDKPIQLITQIEEHLPISYGDKRRLRQVFLNLVSNAVKFTQQGSVTIQVRRQEAGIEVMVKDTGIGIAPEDHAAVFESFRQINKHEMVEPIAGTGLGMPITKYFVESHGGRIWFESEPGVGTTFYVTLPVLSQEHAESLNHQKA